MIFFTFPPPPGAPGTRTILEVPRNPGLTSPNLFGDLPLSISTTQHKQELIVVYLTTPPGVQLTCVRMSAVTSLMSRHLVLGAPVLMVTIEAVNVQRIPLTSNYLRDLLPTEVTSHPIGASAEDLEELSGPIQILRCCFRTTYSTDVFPSVGVALALDEDLEILLHVGYEATISANSQRRRQQPWGERHDLPCVQGFLSPFTSP